MMTPETAVFPFWPQGPVWPMLILIWPLLIGALAGIPGLREKPIRLLPLAPLPALLLALARPADGTTLAPDVLLGVILTTDTLGLTLLGMTAAIWLAAGLYAVAYMKAPRKPAVFTGFWCLTLTGNLGVFLADDVVTFYVSFAAVSLAAYFLVVHDGTQKALRAARIYIALAIFGEAMLLIGFVIGMAGAESLAVADLRAALGAEAGAEGGTLHPFAQGVAITLIIIGFGLKAGLMPLHLWLPLAHPAAPTPASAVLSGAIVKAGIIGLIRLLPEGAVDTGTMLMVTGLASAYLAVLLGLTQSNLKAVLAYSTVSQMGLVIAVIGAGIAASDPQALASAGYYAMHHGFAKAALFLSVGLLAVTRGGGRLALLAGIALVGASVAGLPGTGGALAKAAIKPVFEGWPLWLVTASGIGTSLILLRYLILGARVEADAPRPAMLMSGPVIAMGLCALILPWLLWSAYDPRPLGYLAGAGALIDGIWPILVALAITGIALSPSLAGRIPSPAIPEGDIAVPLERGAIRVIRAATEMEPPVPQAHEWRRVLRVIAPAEALERYLLPWRVSGLVILTLIIAVALASA
jgi:hydrogenase-4 component B